MRDDEDGPVALSPNIKHHPESDHNAQNSSAARPNMANGTAAGGSASAMRVYPPQKPFYFGMLLDM